MSVTRRMEGPGGNMYVPLATYSFRMSFCTVPCSLSGLTPCFSPTTWYMARSTAAGAFIVMEVDTLSRGIPLNTTSMSSRESMATPTLPTSPSARGWSESYPTCVGRSKATERPVCPCSSRNLNLWLVSSAVPNPAYWRMVQRRPRYMVGWTPRVKGYSPGKPSFSE